MFFEIDRFSFQIRRLNQVFAQQSALSKHQFRNLEKQMDKLKERFLNLEKNRFENERKRNFRKILKFEFVQNVNRDGRLFMVDAVERIDSNV